jgi:hypothetical protein
VYSILEGSERDQLVYHICNSRFLLLARGSKCLKQALSKRSGSLLSRNSEDPTVVKVRHTLNTFLPFAWLDFLFVALPPLNAKKNKLESELELEIIVYMWTWSFCPLLLVLNVSAGPELFWCGIIASLQLCKRHWMFKTFEKAA